MTGQGELGHGYRLTDALVDLDLDVVHRALSEDSYWARGRARVITEQAFAASRVAGVLDRDDGTAAFGRAVTDGCTFGWLCDVWVEPAHRGRGLGKALVDHLLTAPDLRAVRRWMLGTLDAHGLYERFGFAPVPGDGEVLQRRGTPAGDYGPGGPDSDGGTA